MATRPATAPEQMPMTVGLPRADPLHQHPGEGCNRGGDLGHGHRHARLHAGGDGGAGVEAEPADPQQRGADEGEHHVVARARVLALAEADRAHQAGNARVDMHDGAAGEVEHLEHGVVVAVGHEAVGAPDPMRDRRVDEDRPQADEPQHRRELHAFGEGAGDQCRCDDREGHLEAEVDGLGDRHRQAVRRADAGRDVAQDALQERATEPAEEWSAGGEREAVGDDRVEDRDQTRDGEARHHGVAHVLLAHHAAVEQAEARDGHHQHERD